jgi:hypothetical protein
MMIPAAAADGMSAPMEPPIPLAWFASTGLGREVKTPMVATYGFLARSSAMLDLALSTVSPILY